MTIHAAGQPVGHIDSVNMSKIQVLNTQNKQKENL